MRNAEKRDLQSRERMKFVLQDLESGGGRSWRQVGLERVVLTTMKIERVGLERVVLTTMKIERERITFLDLRGQKEIVEGRGWCQIWGKVESFFNKQMENYLLEIRCGLF